MEHVKRGLRRFVRIESAPIPQTHGAVISIELWWRGKSYPIAIDISDTMADIQRDILNRSVLYFKMQHLRQGYQSDRVLPGGYTNCSKSYYKFLPWLRAVKDRQPARFEVYGRFGPGESKEIRQRAVEILTAQQHFRYTGAFEMVRGSRSLEEATLSSICIDLPGKGDFCFRLVDYLGIGACIVAFKHRTNLPVPLEDGKHILFAKEDLSDLAELCRYYLEHPEERQRIVRNSREYFDNFLHRDQLAAYYLSKSMERITGS